MRPVRTISDEEEGARIVDMPPFITVKRNSVEPEPVGTIIIKAFRITGYDKDCDGSLMGRLENIDGSNEATGWEVNAIGVEDTDTMVATEDEWAGLFLNEPTRTGAPE